MRALETDGMSKDPQTHPVTTRQPVNHNTFSTISITMKNTVNKQLERGTVVLHKDQQVKGVAMIWSKAVV